MILAADLHLRRTTPRARTDNFFETMGRKFRFILKQAQASPPLLVAGDFFHTPRPGEGLLRWVIDLLREYKVKPIVVPGQHDLPGHSLEQIGESGLGVLAAAGVIQLLTREQFLGPGYHIEAAAYGVTPRNKKRQEPCHLNILLWHHMVINESLWPGQEADKAPAILRKYPQFDLIVTGDNHTSFTTMNGSTKRWLVNPGSMMRMTAAQVNHLPHVFKYENGVVTPITIPIEPDVLDLAELEAVKDKDERISAFVDRLSSQWEAGLSFEKNVEKFFQTNKTDPEVVALVWRCLE
jgi:DNA repair exonuclease SbcCD nuclease subunit